MLENLNKLVRLEVNGSLKMHRYEDCSSLLHHNEIDPFLECIFTCEMKEGLCTLIKKQNMFQTEASKVFEKPTPFKRVAMLIIWLYTAGRVQYNFFKHGKIINIEIYCYEPILISQNYSSAPGLSTKVCESFFQKTTRLHVSLMTFQN